MSKETTILALGVWIMAVPYLGVPSSWKELIFVLSGLAIIIVGFYLRAEALARASGQSMNKASAHRTFVESAPMSHTSLETPPPPHGYEHKERINSLN